MQSPKIWIHRETSIQPESDGLYHVVSKSAAGTLTVARASTHEAAMQQVSLLETTLKNIRDAHYLGEVSVQLTIRSGTENYEVRLQRQPVVLNKTAKATSLPLPSARVWFQQLWKRRLFSTGDQFDLLLGPTPFRGCTNGKQKYAVLLEGVDPQEFDSFFQKLGYRVFKVVPFDIKSFNETAIEVLRFRAPTRSGLNIPLSITAAESKSSI